MKTKAKSISEPSMWLTLRVPMTEYEVTAYVGAPCSDYEADCATCKGWKEWNHDSHCNVLVERDSLVALLLKGEI